MSLQSYNCYTVVFKEIWGLQSYGFYSYQKEFAFIRRLYLS